MNIPRLQTGLRLQQTATPSAFSTTQSRATTITTAARLQRCHTIPHRSYSSINHPRKQRNPCLSASLHPSSSLNELQSSLSHLPIRLFNTSAAARAIAVSLPQPSHLRPILSSTSIRSTLVYYLPLNMAATSNLRQRGAREQSTSTKSTKAATAPTPSSHSHSHDHSHGPFGHSHSHSHSHAGDSEEAAALAAAFSGAGDRGSRIILLGLASNVALTVAKGLGGVFLHSASLLADAGHSLSDLLGDLVVLFSWKLSRRPASKAFQFGYGKFEALGSLIVATLLVGGALGIGVHSYFLFLHALSHAATVAAPELAHAADTMLSNSSSVLGHLGAHAHVHTLDPNAAWIALASVILKEWMYRATMKVAKEEASNVLEANALHHRSDVFSGCLAGVAILGSSLGFPMLDPVGGLLVAGMIIKQGSEIGLNAMKELVDYVVDPELNEKIEAFVLSLREGVETIGQEAHADHAHDHAEHDHAHEHDHEHASVKLPILSVSSVRTFKSGTYTLVDLAIGFPPTQTVQEASAVADKLADAVKAKFPVIKEVVVRFDAEQSQALPK